MRKISKFNINRSKIAEEIPAAIYVRMSTDHQQYSIANQTDAILRYAKKKQMKVVRTYSDKGKSGLSIKGRKGLSNLLSDVEMGKAEYKVILVYDVSRWGRFQDADESAYYEYTCKKAGIKIHYCAEQFENDDSSLSTIMKNLKRAMAGEYSRELSIKTFAGQCRVIRNGFKAGGSAGYGMRRLLIDKDGKPKQVLQIGEAKSISTDRVTLIPGPKEECDTVKLIFSFFVNHGMTSHEIAKTLNEDFKQTDCSKKWIHSGILNILMNEKYIGHNVYNRKSRKLKGPCVMNPPDKWVRANDVFEPIISKGIFRKAQKLIKSQRRSMSDEDMLKGLEKAYKQNGYLSAAVIDAAKNIPTANIYIIRFKSLYTAYALVGFHHNQPGRSEEELLVKLKALYKKHGYLSSSLINKSEDMPCRNTYRIRFGSIERAYDLVGYKQGGFRIPPKVMLDKLAKLYKKNGFLTEDVVNKSETTPRASVYRKAFGSLKTAYRLIGFDPDSIKISNAELKENLKIIYNKHGYLSGPLIDAADFPYNRRFYAKRFGSLIDAYAAAGYKVEKYGMSNEVMLLKLKDFYKEKGYLSQRLIDDCEELPSSRTFSNRFGSLRKVYELVGFNSEKKELSNDFMLQKLTDLLREKGYLSYRVIVSCEGIPCVNTYIKRFGSLKNVYNLIGYKSKYILKRDKP